MKVTSKISLKRADEWDLSVVGASLMLVLLSIVTDSVTCGYTEANEYDGGLMSGERATTATFKRTFEQRQQQPTSLRAFTGRRSSNLNSFVRSQPRSAAFTTGLRPLSLFPEKPEELANINKQQQQQPLSPIGASLFKMTSPKRSPSTAASATIKHHQLDLNLGLMLPTSISESSAAAAAEAFNQSNTRGQLLSSSAAQDNDNNNSNDRLALSSSSRTKKRTTNKQAARVARKSAANLPVGSQQKEIEASAAAAAAGVQLNKMQAAIEAV